MKPTTLLLSTISAAALLGAGCVAPVSPRKGQTVYWSTLNPGDIHPTEQVLNAGPFHFGMNPRSAFLHHSRKNIYKGDDTPWLDKTEDMRNNLAKILGGYPLDKLTLCDYAKGRNGYLSERLGWDYIISDEGRDGEKAVLASGTKWATRDIIFSEILRLSPLFNDGLFVGTKTPANGSVNIEEVEEVYCCADAPPVIETTIYLRDYGLKGKEPTPKLSFVAIPDQTVKILMISESEREVPGGREVDVNTPHGKITVFKPDSQTWLYRQQERLLCQAVIKLLNELTEEQLQSIVGNE